MQINPDEKGLYIRATPDIEENAEARALYSFIKRGDIDGMSSGYSKLYLFQLER